MNNSRSSYREVMKGTSLFGGVLVFNVFIQVIRSKIIAILLGTTGMGVYGLLTNTLSLVASLTNMGLNMSAIKDISAAHQTQDTHKMAVVVKSFRSLIWVTGILGAVVLLVFAPWLSQITFENKNYTLAFIWLSITLLVNQLSQGQLVVIQGMRKFHELAKANLLGSFFGLLFTIPLYYYWRIEGIVPSLILTSLITLLFSWLFSRKIHIEPVKITSGQVISEGKGMVKMGFLISLSGLFTVATSYIIRVFINQASGLDDVGLYSAGFLIVNTYVGFVFNAMSTDYYPRLSAIATSNRLCRKSINEQSEVMILVLVPILIIFMICIRWIIILLFSHKFIATQGMIYWATLGMLFRAPAWAMSFVLVAKGDGKRYFWSQLTSNLYATAFNITGYLYGGLTGIGISFLISYIVYYVHIYWICNAKYRFSFTKDFMKIFGIQLLLIIISLLAMLLLPAVYSYIIGSIMLGASGLYSLYELDKRLNLHEIWTSLKIYHKKRK